jgi:predicted regulator of Ras-like GTPase activity (Roadblock/LC7/MglB family)
LGVITVGGQIDDVVKDLVSVNNTIGAIAVLDSNGNVVYATQNWKVNGTELIASWRNKAPAVSVQNVKYSTLQATEERLIATNVAGKGHIVMSTVGEKGVLIAYVTAQGDPGVSYADVARAAAAIQHAI